MSNGNPEKYIPGPESTAKIVREAEVGPRKNSSFIQEGHPYINPFLIYAGALAKEVAQGRVAKEVKQKSVMLNRTLREYMGNTGNPWTLIELDESSEIWMLNALTIGSNPVRGNIDRWMDWDVKALTKQLSHCLIDVSVKDTWHGQAEVFPLEAYALEQDQSGVGIQPPARRWLSWKRQTLDTVGNLYPEDSRTVPEAVKVLDKLQVEPVVKGWGQKSSLDQRVNTREGDLTLRDLGILSPKDFMELDMNVISEVAVGLLDNESAFRRHLAKAIFLSPVELPLTRYDQSQSQEVLGQETFFSVLSMWRDVILTDLILPQSGANDELLETFLERIDVRDGHILFGAGLARKIFGYYMTTLWSDKEVDTSGFEPLIQESNTHFQQSRGGDPNILAGAFERPYVAVREFLNPHLRERLSSLGYGAKFENIMDEDTICKEPWDEYSGKQIEDHFKTPARSGVAEFGAQKKEQIDDISDKIWNRIIAGGVSYLQGGEQVSTVHLEHGSIATRAGLDAVRLVKSAKSLDWRMNILLQFSDYKAVPALGGFVDHNGDLTLRSDITDRLPGYASILRHIAIASIYDLVRKSNEELRLTKEVKQYEDSTSPDEEGKTNTQSRNGLMRLPRKGSPWKERKRNEGISDNGFTTRHIDGHKTALQGTKKLEGDFADWTKIYLNELLAAPLDSRAAVTSAYQEVIREADAQAHKISSGKENNIPFGMRLKGVILPFSTDNEGVHVCFPLRRTETWTIPHVSPAVTDEERVSLPTSFEKRFRGSGSQWLEWLEYMYLEGIK